MNEIFTNPKKMREYEEYIVKISNIYQRIGMGATLVTWIMFFFLYEPDMFRPLVWIFVVGMQFPVINKLLECQIPIWYENMPRIPKTKEVRWFVFWGALVLLLAYEKAMQIPLLVMYVVLIWLGAKMVYEFTEML